MQNNNNYIVHACTCTWYIKHRIKKCIMLKLTANLLILQYICDQWFQFLLFYSIATKLLICPFCANIMHAAAYTTQHTQTCRCNHNLCEKVEEMKNEFNIIHFRKMIFLGIDLVYSYIVQCKLWMTFYLKRQGSHQTDNKMTRSVIINCSALSAFSFTMKIKQRCVNLQSVFIQQYLGTKSALCCGSMLRNKAPSQQTMSLQGCSGLIFPLTTMQILLQGHHVLSFVRPLRDPQGSNFTNVKVFTCKKGFEHLVYTLCSCGSSYFYQDITFAG